MLTVPDASGSGGEMGLCMDKEEGEQQTVKVSASQLIPHVANTERKHQYPY
jgi:hypothetical protein